LYFRSAMIVLYLHYWQASTATNVYLFGQVRCGAATCDSH
jgi:hypothetical protein